MGSGSSKSKGRAIKICGQGLPDAPVLPIGSRTTIVTCDQKKGGNNKETFVERNSSVASTEKSRFAAVDPDLKLIEDILGDSEDCFPWPASPFEWQLTSSQDTTTNQGLSLQVQQNLRVDNKSLQTITNKPMAEYEGIQCQHQTARDDCRTTVSKCVLCSLLEFKYTKTTCYRVPKGFLTPPKG